MKNLKTWIIFLSTFMNLCACCCAMKVLPNSSSMNDSIISVDSTTITLSSPKSILTTETNDNKQECATPKTIFVHASTLSSLRSDQAQTLQQLEPIPEISSPPPLKTTTIPEHPVTLSSLKSDSFSTSSNSYSQAKTTEQPETKYKITWEALPTMGSAINGIAFFYTEQPRYKLIEDEKKGPTDEALNNPFFKEWYADGCENNENLKDFVSVLIKHFFTDLNHPSASLYNHRIVAFDLDDTAMTYFDSLTTVNNQSLSEKEIKKRYIQLMQPNKQILKLCNFFKQKKYEIVFFSSGLASSLGDNDAIMQALSKAGYINKYENNVYIQKDKRDFSTILARKDETKTKHLGSFKLYVVSSNPLVLQHHQIDYAIWVPSALRRYPEEEELRKRLETKCPCCTML